MTRGSAGGQNTGYFAKIMPARKNGRWSIKSATKFLYFWQTFERLVASINWQKAARLTNNCKQRRGLESLSLNRKNNCTLYIYFMKKARRGCHLQETKGDYRIDVALASAQYANLFYWLPMMRIYYFAGIVKTDRQTGNLKHRLISKTTGSYFHVSHLHHGNRGRNARYTQQQWIDMRYWLPAPPATVETRQNMPENVISDASDCLFFRM